MTERSFASRDEWELMYRRGMSNGKIAELCNVPVRTVNWTISRRSLVDPGLKEEHKRNATAVPMNTLTPGWQQRLRQFEFFLAEHRAAAKIKRRQ
ncbi:hypothetical protein [Arthrobacter sp. efr-133-TYG-118]|uniref:hypothetical protein n=1 Tax=Arthrobacter sp. efr-133-TYG-118 TaxID=3040279 RepID=UPI00254C8353|nr:hypothetical protein [Arthrobacter sp. efr-133-TYG-118]